MANFQAHSDMLLQQQQFLQAHSDMLLQQQQLLQAHSDMLLQQQQLLTTILPVAVQLPQAVANTSTPAAASSVQHAVVNTSTSGPAPAPTVQPEIGINTSVSAPTHQPRSGVSHPDSLQTPADTAFFRSFDALGDTHKRTKKPIILPDALNLKESLNKPAPLLRLPQEIINNLIKYLPPKDVISLAKTCRSSFMSVSDSVPHFMSVSSTASVQPDSRGDEEIDTNTSTTLKSWALFTSDFLDKVCDDTDRISHVTIKCRRNQRFVGMDGYASLRAVLRQNEFRSITQLTVTGRVHISTQHLLFTLSNLTKLRNLVVSNVPSIDPAIFLRKVIFEYGDRMSVDFHPIMPENIGGSQNWYEHHLTYFVELYFMILPYAKKVMPTLLAPGSGLYNFLLRTFCGDNGIEGTLDTCIRALMSELYRLAPELCRKMVRPIDAGVNSGVQRSTRFGRISWKSRNRAYVDAATKLIRTIATNWKVSKTCRVDISFCDKHDLVFHMFWPQCRHSRIRGCWLDEVEQSYESMHVHDEDAADMRDLMSTFMDSTTSDKAHDICLPSGLPFPMPLIDQADPATSSAMHSNDVPPRPVADSGQNMGA